MAPKAGSKVNEASFRINEIEEKWSRSIKANDSPQVDLQLERWGAVTTVGFSSSY